MKKNSLPFYTWMSTVLVSFLPLNGYNNKKRMKKGISGFDMKVVTKWKQKKENHDEQKRSKKKLVMSKNVNVLPFLCLHKL